MKNHLPVFGRRAGCSLSKLVRKNLFVYIPIIFLFNLINLNAQVSGRVYKDFDVNGVWDSTATHFDQGRAGVLVEVFDKNGVLKGSATTAISGKYLIPNVTGNVRVHFRLPSFYTDGFITKSNQASQSNIQFVTAPNNGVDLGLNFADDYCGEDPKIVVPCYTVGIATTPAADAGLALFNYSASGTDYSQIKMPNATLSYMGSTWGGAYQKETNSFFTAAFMKRHSNFGVGGTGAIYLTKNVSDVPNSSTELYLDLNALGFDTGSDSHSAPDYQADTINPRGNPFDDVGKKSLGDLDISYDGKYLFVVNLHQRKLYRIFIDNPRKPTGTITAADVTTWDIPSGFDEVNKGVGRPFGLLVRQEKVYVGVVCDASISQDTADLKARVYEMKPDDAIPSWKLDIEFPLSYRKGRATWERPESEYWKPWISDWWVPGQPEYLRGKPDVTVDKYISYPMPLISDIEIDTDGSMMVALTDRFSHQVRFAGVDARGKHHGTFGFDSRLGGDLIRIGRCDGVNWTLENNGTVCGAASGGKDNNQGPGGGEYYHGDSNEPLGHFELSVGSLCFRPGSREICLASTDPINPYSAGITWLDNEKGNKKRVLEIISELDDIIIGAPVQFGKASSLGDINIICAVSPLEIGNRVWRDDNGNGVQDAGESGIADVLMVLVNNANQIVGRDTTDINGVYSFNHLNVVDTVGVGKSARLGPQPKTNYTIRVKGKILSSLPVARGGRVAAFGTEVINDGGKLIDDNVLGNSNKGSGALQDLLDSDGILDLNDGIINLTTEGVGESNHTYDFAYCPLPKADLVAQKATCDAITDTLLNNASITLSNLQFAQKVGYSLGSVYTGPVFADAKDLNFQTVFKIDSLLGGATDQIYTVRIFNGSDSCARDIQVTVEGTVCLPCQITGTADASSILVNNNGTPSDPTDDYFTVKVQANATNAGAADLYEVVLNANANGTGGTVLNPGGTYYNQPVKVGLGKELKANSQAIKLTVRDAIKPACVSSVDVQADPFRLECKTDICLPLKVGKL
ncbi:MAG: SdrD B-like domain-containing protein [Arcicella sp.]|nr:SdrD B-like domain-containing protein [Arcicella sp.]